jgi:hypothetical protein
VARRFDGTDDYALVEGLVGGIPARVTLGFWFRQPTVSGRIIQLSEDGVADFDATGFGLGLRFADTDLLMQGYTQNGATSAAEIGATGSTSPSSSWRLAILESDRTGTPDHGWFLGATAVGSRSDWAGRGTATLANLLLAARNPTTPDIFASVDLAHVFILDYWLSGGEKTTLAGGGSPAALTTPPLYYWRLNGSGSTEAEHYGGTSLTLVGGVATTDGPNVDDPPGGGVVFIGELAAAPATVDANFGAFEPVPFDAELAAAPAVVDAEVTVVIYTDLDLLASPAALDAGFEVRVAFDAELAAGPAGVDADFGVSEEVAFDAELTAAPAAVDADFVVWVAFDAELDGSGATLQALFGVEGALPVAFGAELSGEDAVLDWTSYLRIEFEGELRGGQETLLAGFPALKASGSGSAPRGAFLLF